MECINKVELQGRVGSVRAIPLSVNGPKVYRFSLATDYVLRTREGYVVIETTWHNVSMTEAKAGELNWLEKGRVIHLVGRIRNVKFSDANGTEHTVSEIVADDILTIKE